MSRFAERTRGVTLTLLDVDRLDAEISEQVGGPHKVGFAPYAMAERNGHLYVVCVEGVGWEVSDDRPLALDVYTDNPGTIGIIPKFQAKLSPAEVRELATDQTVDLADHVRTFGDRLESNFWSWYRRLTRPALADNFGHRIVEV